MAEALEPIKDLLHRVRGVVSRQRSGENSGLRVVKDPADAEIDIVAVHGLGGEGFRSWITWDPKAGKSRSWLEELLGKDVPSARIMTYGYISDGLNYRYLVRNVLYGRALDLVKELGAQRLRDRSNRRPLVFIAHSLGGWIVKRALIISSEATEPALKDIELSTCGVAFFGTLSPGRPSSPSPLAHVIRRTTSALGDDARRSRAQTMAMQPQPNDIEWLENQMEAFKAITANLPRLSFHETKMSRDGFVVEKTQSMAPSDGEQIGLTATHSDLVKFRGRDANYRTFITKFRDMVDKARTSGLIESKRKVFDLAAVHHLEYLSTGFEIPYKLPTEPAVIVQRQDLMDRLEAVLNAPADPQTLHLSIAALWGPAGTGKTTLAKHYAEVHRKDISFVFWVWAESRETIIASYLELANALVTHYARNATRSQVENDLGLMGVEEMLKVKSIMQLRDPLRVNSVIRAVKDWLMRPQNDKWLLVFDHVESSYDIFEFIPLTLSGRVLLTSTDNNCCSWGTKLEVDAMTEEEAVDLLGTIVGSEVLEDSEQIAAARTVAQQLDYHPQSISLAASAIRRKDLTISEYRSKLELKLPLDLLGSAIDQSPVAKTILRVSAMLSSTIIPVTLFGATSHIKEVPFRFTNIFAELTAFRDEGHLDDVLQHLWEQNFIQTPSPTDSTYSSQSSSQSFDYFLLDPAARAHVRGSLTPDEEIDHAWLACNVCVDGIKKKENDLSTLPEIHDFGRIMAPHAKACYDDRSGALDQWPEDDDIAWHVLGNVCMTQGAVEQAIGCFELSLKQQVSMDPMEKIQTSLALASLLQKTGNVSRSTEVLSNINITSIDRAVGFQVAMAKASAAAEQGEYDQAEDQYESLEHEQEELLGPTNPETVSTVRQLASTLEHLGKMEEAQALYRRVYLSYRNKFGQSHPMTLDALEDLARISKESNAIDEAEALYRQSVDIRTRTLGADHPTTAHALQKLAVIDDVRSRHADARAKYQRALDLMAPTLGRAHPLYTTTMENMALSARWQGHTLGDEAALDADDHDEDPPARRSSAAASTSTRSGRKAAALLRETRRRAAFEDAERLYLDVVAIKRAAAGLYAHKDVVETGTKLGEMYENEDFFAEARVAKVEELLGLLREVRRRGTF